MHNNNNNNNSSSSNNVNDVNKNTKQLRSVDQKIKLLMLSRSLQLTVKCYFIREHILFLHVIGEDVVVEKEFLKRSFDLYAPKVVILAGMEVKLVYLTAQGTQDVMQ